MPLYSNAIACKNTHVGGRWHLLSSNKMKGRSGLQQVLYFLMYIYATAFISAVRHISAQSGPGSTKCMITYLNFGI